MSDLPQQRYEVDCAMTDGEIPESEIPHFCRCLQEIVGNRIEIVPITDSHNGAGMTLRDDTCDEWDEPTPAEWGQAMDQYAAEENQP